MDQSGNESLSSEISVTTSTAPVVVPPTTSGGGGSVSILVASAVRSSFRSSYWAGFSPDIAAPQKNSLSLEGESGFCCWLVGVRGFEPPAPAPGLHKHTRLLSRA